MNCNKTDRNITHLEHKQLFQKVNPMKQLHKNNKLHKQFTKTKNKIKSAGRTKIVP